MISEVDWFQSLRHNESPRSLFLKSTLDVQILAYLTGYSRTLPVLRWLVPIYMRVGYVFDSSFSE